MKSIGLALLLALLIKPLFAQRQLYCDSFCVTSIAMDTAIHGTLDVTLYNGNSSHVNYPRVEVVINGDTVAKQPDLYYYAQLGKTSLVHYVKTTLDSVPRNFKCKVVLIGSFNMDTCVLDYPCLVNDNVGIAKSRVEHRVSVYPNPGSGLFHLLVSGGGSAAYQVMDMYGRQIIHGQIPASEFDISLEGKSPGVYFLQIYSDGDSKVYPLMVK